MEENKVNKMIISKNVIKNGYKYLKLLAVLEEEGKTIISIQETWRMIIIYYKYKEEI